MNERLEDTTERAAIPAQRHDAADGPLGGPVGWVAVHRLLTGQPVGPAADGLRALLASASAPATAAERNQAGLNLLLDAYRQAAATSAGAAPAGAASTTRPATAGRAPRRVGRAMAVKCTSVLLVAVGTGAAAAGTDMLPASIQRVAHHYFGGLGIPGPALAPGSPGARASSSPSPRPSGSATALAGATPVGELITLCGQIPHGSKNWRNGLDAADQAKLITAAGADLKVTSFCAQLLANPGSAAGTGASATPSPGATGSASASASPGDDASAKPGKGKDTHTPSPNPHSTTANH